MVVKYLLSEDKMRDYPFAHSRLDKIGTPRLHLSFPLVGNLSSDSEQVGRILDKPE